MTEYHKNLTSKGYRALIFSNDDHDMCVPYTGSQVWMKYVRYKIVDEWRPWSSNGQVAGDLATLFWNINHERHWTFTNTFWLDCQYETTGAPATLLIFNNEKGFSPRNIEYICSVGLSTKKGKRSSGYKGDKVPKWVEERPTLQDIKQIYDAGDDLVPTTTIVFPLKPDKVNPVKQQLSNFHPEVLLFLAKIRHLSVREDRLTL
ncbi:hypothetical protein JHK87_006766 [Glycine soja]|nr:hypothetical protein JHK87_006766 [Glycine soja]